MNLNNDRTKLQNRETQTRQKNINIIDKQAESIITEFRSNISNIYDRFKIVDILREKAMSEEADDILRFQIVYIMSALDFFMHEIYSYSMIKIFRNEMPKTTKYYDYRVPLKLVELAVRHPENLDLHLRDAFIDLNSGFTFMAPGRIKELLNIITPEDEFVMVERKLKNKNIIPQESRLDHILEEIYIRRNKIAHQTDIDHGSNSKNNITEDEVKGYIRIVSQMVEELYKIICK